METPCSGTVDSEGAIYSPNFPGLYPHNLSCRTLVQAPNGMVINFIFFDLEVVCNDSVVIYDGSDESSPVLSDLDCGNLRGGYLQSSGQNALLVFQSDESEAGIGFRILAQFRPGNTPFIGFRILSFVQAIHLSLDLENLLSFVQVIHLSLDLKYLLSSVQVRNKPFIGFRILTQFRPVNFTPFKLLLKR